ncbi:hypothetical protein T484DRAFT_1814675 [Baffinella frigidus]|nr:hypothetical protein T484DRAFT_1814675 [Cryptophyta sp. CCMP2293]
MSSHSTSRQSSNDDAAAAPSRSSFARLRKGAESAAEVTRSDEMGVETMDGLTSAPSILIGGCIMFVDPNAEVKRIRQLPALRRASERRKTPATEHEGQGPAVSHDAFPRRHPASRPKILRMPSTPPQKISFLRASSTASSARSDVTSSSLTITRTTMDFTRATSDSHTSRRVESHFTWATSFTRAASDSHASRRVTDGGEGRGQGGHVEAGASRTRPFVRSARFGEPADWGQSASLQLPGDFYRKGESTELLPRGGGGGVLGKWHGGFPASETPVVMLHVLMTDE